MNALLRHALPFLTVVLAFPSAAKDSLGVFGQWGVFRDPEVPRCYAIAAANETTRRSDYAAYASVGSWPRQGVRGQVHFRMSRKLARGAGITLLVGRETFELEGGSGDAWAADQRMDAAIIAAMRAASSMQVTARDDRGNRFRDLYSLEGAATAMDAASIGCARL